MAQVMNSRTHEISGLTGQEFQNLLIRLHQKTEEWKGGKLYKFLYKMGKVVVVYFEIKAMKRPNPIEEILTFTIGDKITWEDSKENLQDEDFPEYYEKFLVQKLNTFANDIKKNSEFMRLCIMLTVEIARWTITPRQDLIEAIGQALHRNTDEDLEDLRKMFPKKECTKIEESRRQHALSCINRRGKMGVVEDIRKRWPLGADFETALKILSRDPVEREYAFKQFVESQERFENTLLSQNPRTLSYFTTILSARNVSEAERAFQQLSLELDRQEN